MTTTIDETARFVPVVPEPDALDDVFPVKVEVEPRLYIRDELMESTGLDPAAEGERVKGLIAAKNKQWEPGVTQEAWYKGWLKKIEEIRALQEL